MKNKIKLLGVMGFMAVALFSCTDIDTVDVEKDALKDLYEKRDKQKWAEEDSLKKKNFDDSVRIADANKRTYELYLEDLREYKKTKHPVMFGWFNAWSSVTPGDYANLTLIPDSMDIVSIWGNCFNLDAKRQEQMKVVQSKGTKVIVGWIIENVGNGIGNRAKNEWSSDPETGIKEYAQAIVDSVAKYGYDGFDIDYEPSYASPFKGGNHCGDWITGNWEKNKPIISCQKDDNKEYENLFFRTLRAGLDELTKKDGKERILNINGSIHWLSKDVVDCFNYFVAQAYNQSYSRWTSEATSRLGNDIKDKIIYTESFENKPGNRANFMKYADFVVTDLQGVAGGIGAYHINEDSFDGNQYRNVRKAISRMNPPIK